MPIFEVTDGVAKWYRMWTASKAGLETNSSQDAFMFYRQELLKRREATRWSWPQEEARNSPGTAASKKVDDRSIVI